MPESKNYPQLTTDALLAEQKKIKNMQLFLAGFIGMLIGAIIYGMATRGFGFLYVGLSVGLIVLLSRGSQGNKEQLKQIHAELDARQG